jgi:dynein intermediate chain 4, axonemal
MASYSGHMGPVYRVQWSCFRPGLFLSCSADWTVRLWSAERAAPLVTFQHGIDEVSDVQWCPQNSTVFATSTSGGAVDVWDFSESTLRPVTSFAKDGLRMTCVRFHEHNAALAAGDSDGGVSVLRLFGVTREAEGPEEQAARLAAAMDANVMKTEPAAPAGESAGG